MRLNPTSVEIKIMPFVILKKFYEMLLCRFVHKFYQTRYTKSFEKSHDVLIHVLSMNWDLKQLLKKFPLLFIQKMYYVKCGQEITVQQPNVWVHFSAYVFTKPSCSSATVEEKYNTGTQWYCIIIYVPVWFLFLPCWYCILYKQEINA